MSYGQKLSYSKELTPQTFIKMLIDPVLIIATLIGLTVYEREPLDPKYFVLFMIVFALSFPGNWSRGKTLRAEMEHIFSNWLFIVSFVIIFGYATGYINSFPHELMVVWLWLTPIILLIGHIAISKFLSSIQYTSYANRTAVIVGVSDLGLQLRNKMKTEVELNLEFKGFFDDRDLPRFKKFIETLYLREHEIIGQYSLLSEYVKTNAIDIIYIALPMTSQPRVLDLLDDLKDTTTSIYFVPDIFMFDLIQARIDDVAGIPVVAVCETPFSGINGLIKRVSDIVMTLFLLIPLSPIMLMIGLSVKLSSPGPVLFKQKRYGLDGQEILVYKFRSMTVTENGHTVVQATKNDKRVTKLGAFLRKTSLDELPQFINVLQGRMSIVGPRPHAVSHNETYRKIIKGYMIRHKVKPGITGWAQVNGLRGETDTIDKMQARIEYDIDYLRQWSLALDTKIIFRTVFLVFMDAQAY
ncbi:MAG: undecaprenyl-phosphate glucose phosphotransferase [Methylophilaceae bacterium]|nr:undecaprenyl-phosphate glucose phosphotransferase [Methylophilaceae bacterium]